MIIAMTVVVHSMHSIEGMPPGGLESGVHSRVPALEALRPEDRSASTRCDGYVAQADSESF